MIFIISDNVFAFNKIKEAKEEIESRNAIT